MLPASWRVSEGALILPLEEAEWWGVSLGVLVAAIHHPQLLDDQQPETDVDEVAREVLERLGDLEEAADIVDVTAGDDSAMATVVRRKGAFIIVRPGVEVGHLAYCLEIFARAVLGPTSEEARVARGATAYAASAWSLNIGRETGTLGSAHDE